MSMNDVKNCREPMGKGIVVIPDMQLMADPTTGELRGEGVVCTARTVQDMKGIFRDEKIRQSLDQAKIVYRVQSVFPVPEGEEGGLFWGTTFIEPGMVGDEYFMTKGHFHANQHRSEFYMTVAGHGALILMQEDRTTTFEAMRPGTLHYIAAHTAHRVVNTGDSVLAFWACWPSDAGHNYEAIARGGFGARLRKVGGMPTLVEDE